MSWAANINTVNINLYKYELTYFYIYSVKLYLNQKQFIVSTKHFILLCGHLVGHIMRLAHPSVCPEWAQNSRTKNVDIDVNVNAPQEHE